MPFHMQQAGAQTTSGNPDVAYAFAGRVTFVLGDTTRSAAISPVNRQV